jgi:photosystem II stability/assembly factor-like uncharacterized protein
MKLALKLSTVLGLAAMIALAFGNHGCKKKDKGTGDGGGGAWLVGQNGTMVNVSPQGQVGGYDLDSTDDFLDIACKGSDTAWVVGEGGTLLRSFDAGASWQALDLSTTVTLRAVAAAESDVIYVVGDNGLALVSDDLGDSFRDLPTDGQAWTAVATSHDGAVAILGAADGSLWRAAGELEQVHDGGPAIRAVGVSATGQIAVAVGDDGRILRSIDGGTSWQAQTAGDGALHDVWVTGDGGRALAVGDGGRLVAIHDAGWDEQPIADDVALRGIHLSADGRGMVVGDGGTALQTFDRGASWSPVDLATDRTLHAVDDIHAVPHL